MTALALQQQALLDALFVRTHEGGETRLTTLLAGDASRGLLAYRSHGHALAERVLQAAYPVLAEFAGIENFAPLARALWHDHTPGCGDLAHWGGALPDWLDTADVLAQEPCLRDLARVEWALHDAAGAADAQLDLPSFERLSREDPRHLAFHLAPGTTVIDSRWPVVSLMQAHREGSPTLSEAGERLRRGVGECALVWRQGFRPCLTSCAAAEAAWLRALLAGFPLTQAMDAVAGTDFQLPCWLPHAVQQGVVLGVVSHLSPTQATP